jgi:hypothetical protein
MIIFNNNSGKQFSKQNEIVKRINYTGLNLNLLSNNKYIKINNLNNLNNGIDFASNNSSIKKKQNKIIINKNI